MVTIRRPLFVTNAIVNKFNNFFCNIASKLVEKLDNRPFNNAIITDNLTKTVSDLVDYPGITDLMDARSTYLKAYSGYSGAPVITKPNHTLQR